MSSESTTTLGNFSSARAIASSAFALHTAPVGLDGLENISTRVRGVKTFSQSSGCGAQPSPGRSISSTTLAPASLTISG